jgi:transcriptional regulator with XRE-family HTH domain
MPKKGSTIVGEDRQEAFNAELAARVKALRAARDWTQAEMAAHLGVPLERYKKYETRSPLPHFLIEAFAIAVGRDAAFVLTGKTRRKIK